LGRTIIKERRLFLVNERLFLFASDAMGFPMALDRWFDYPRISLQAEGLEEA
jgi:hypothetical protein